MKKRALLILGGTIALAAAVLACGPQLTEAFLSDARAILNVPEAWYRFEIKRIRHQPQPPKKLQAAARVSKNWEHPLPSTWEVDVADLRRVLSAANTPQTEREIALSGYEELRLDQLSLWKDAEMRSLPAGRKKESAAIAKHRWIEQDAWPSCIPKEFQLYAEGADLLNDRDTLGARDRWEELLNLPVEQRRERSAWAAWMLMKTAATPVDATLWLQTVCRVIEEEGCADSLRMHPAALALLSSNQSEAASQATLALHFTNAKANERNVYMYKMAETAWAIARSDDMKMKIEAAKNAATRELITSILAHDVSFIDGSIDRPWGEDVSAEKALEAWAAALTEAGVKSDPILGDFGIALYRIHHFDLARRFLPLGSSTWETLWIQSKLDFQGGRQNMAIRHMSEALRLFPAGERKHIVSVTDTVFERNEQIEPMDEEWMHGVRNSRFLAECATVRLSQADFSSALGLFLEASCPQDAAYVAEQLLSADELLQFIRKNGLKLHSEIIETTDLPQPPSWGRWPDSRTEDPTHRFLYLSARRLAREGRFKDAREYFPPTILPCLDRYVVLIRRSRSVALALRVRAECLMEAARFHRWMGMELFGAEIEPDAALWDGEYAYEPLFPKRALWQTGLDHNADGDSEPDALKLKPPVLPIPLRPSREEIKRAKRFGLADRPRFHYRYVAAQMAREASHLLPQDSDEAAAMLAEGGLWLPPNDGGIDPYFEELITRFAKTPLGQEADRLRWYPRALMPITRPWDPQTALATPIPGDTAP